MGNLTQPSQCTEWQCSLTLGSHLLFFLMYLSSFRFMRYTTGFELMHGFEFNQSVSFTFQSPNLQRRSAPSCVHKGPCFGTVLFFWREHVGHHLQDAETNASCICDICSRCGFRATGLLLLCECIQLTAYKYHVRKTC